MVWPVATRLSAEGSVVGFDWVPAAPAVPVGDTYKALPAGGVEALVDGVVGGVVGGGVGVVVVEDDVGVPTPPVQAVPLSAKSVGKALAVVQVPLNPIEVMAPVASAPL